VSRDGLTLGRGQHRVAAGDLLQVAYCYRIPAAARLTFYLDRDKNPFNVNHHFVLASRDLKPSGSAVAEAAHSWRMPELNPEESYFLCAEITDNASHRRYMYAVPEFREEPDQSAEPCMVTAFPSEIRPFFGQGGRTRLLLFIGGGQAVFSGHCEPVWQTGAIQTLGVWAFFKRFMLVMVRLDFGKLDSGLHVFTVGGCDGAISINGRGTATAETAGQKRDQDRLSR
jgi:hypothetical protein